MASETTNYKWIGKRTIRPDGVDKVHARIKSIDTGKAEALPGVKAVATSADLPLPESKWVPAGEVQVNYRYLSGNVLAREKVLYDGHALAAVAATSDAIADEALSLIEVGYEVLPHVIDVVEAMKPDAPLLHEDLITEGVTPVPDKPSNVAKRIDLARGDVEAGFAKADVIVERDYTTKPVHQGYIEPHAVVADTNEDGKSQVWCSSQGQFMVRTFCANILGIEASQLRVTPAEIGGGFGGKTVVYIEPVAVLLSRKAGRPVRMVMTREEVFRGSGPTSGSAMTAKIGATKDGTITAAEVTLKYQAGAYPGSPVQPGCMTCLAPYELEDFKIVGYDVVVNRPKVAAYRAPGAPVAAFAVESALDELAKRLDLDPIDLREKNAAKEGTQATYGPKYRAIGYAETLQAVRNHPQCQVPLGPNQGRGVASGFWFNIGGETSAAVNVNEDGTVIVITGNPDIGGSRASMAIMAAEVLGVDIDKIQPIVADTSSIGYNFLTGGSRVTFAAGMAVIEAAEKVVQDLRERAAKIWEVDADAVVWEDGCARPASSNVGDFEPLSLTDIAGMSAKTGGPISGHVQINAQGAGPGFGTHVCDVEVDRETGRVTILRYTAVQDVGRAIHPGYVEGQLQGGAAQGIGWALNEEYIYNEDGRLENPGFLDYRIPVASDLPMIDTVLVEVPNPGHPYGVRGVGEVPIVPPMAAVANAIENATGVRLSDLPMSPPKVLAALDDGG
jgi:CO/xanthine dehydrogenase Mo-binding subunit